MIWDKEILFKLKYDKKLTQEISMFVFAPQKKMARSLNYHMVAVLVSSINKQWFVIYFLVLIDLMKAS